MKRDAFSVFMFCLVYLPLKLLLTSIRDQRRRYCLQTMCGFRPPYQVLPVFISIRPVTRLFYFIGFRGSNNFVIPSNQKICRYDKSNLTIYLD